MKPACSFYNIVFVVGLTLSSIPGSPALAAEASVVDIGSRVELFADRFLIENLKDARLRLHRPIPRQIVFTFDAPWEREQSGYVTILKDADQYRMYYLAGGDLSRERTCLALSKDGVHWERPRLGLFEFNGSRENNIIWTGKYPTACEAHNFSPFIDLNPAASGDQRYKAVTLTRLGEGRNRRGNVLLAMASPDGIHWRKLREEPILTEGAFDSHNTAFWDTNRKQYVCFLRENHQGRRSIALATSSDFIQWTRPQLLDFGPTPPEHLYTNGIVQYFRAPHIYLGFPARFIPPTDRNRIGLEQRQTDGLSDAVFMCSRDGRHWDRSFMEALIRPGPDPLNWGGAHGNSFPAWGILPSNGETISIYWADHYGNYPNMHLTPRLWRGTVRTDGFTSLSFPYRGGELITKPLRFAGASLVINYATSAAGGVRVEIQDSEGKPISGFALEDCIEFWGDEIERVVAWRRGHEISNLAGASVRLRFVLRDADLYSIRFRPSS